jgi:hypothetical protein
MARVLPIVQQWLDGEPLAERISTNPQEENLKVSHLKNLVSAIHDSGKRTAGKMIS